MRYLWTIRYVSLPTLAGMAPRLVLLGCWIAFERTGAELFGNQLSALALATAACVFVLFTRNMLLKMPKPVQVGEWIAIGLAFGIVTWVLWGVFRAELDYSVQKGWTAYLLFFAAANLTISRFAPEVLLKSIPDASDKAREAAPKINDAVAFGYFLRGLTAEALAQMAPVSFWVAFMTLGSILFEFLLRWVIMMMVWSDEETGSR